MKSKKIITTVLAAAIALSALTLSSCSTSDKSITDTKYSLTMIGSLPVKEGTQTEVDTQTFNGSVWGAIKEIGDSEAKFYKYYPPVFADVSDSVAYADTITEGYKKQLSLSSAVMNERGIIVLPGEQTLTAYNVAKGEKAAENLKFLLVGVPALSDNAKTEYLNARTVAIVFNDVEYGYLFGYTAVKSGNTKLGYVGLENERSKGIIEGFLLGAQAAATEISLAPSSLSFTYAFYNVTSKDANTSSVAAGSVATAAELVLAGDAVAEKALTDAGASGIMSVTATSATPVKFSYSLDYKSLKKLVKEEIGIAQSAEKALVRVAGCGDKLFSYIGGEGSTFTSDDADALITAVAAFADTDKALSADGNIDDGEYSIAIAKK